MALPLFDQGTALNMVDHPVENGLTAFRHELIPEHTWLANLFGRATLSMVLSREVKRAYNAVERELETVAQIQQSLLPAQLPKIPHLDLAVHYQTSKQAGGDYYDFFPLPNGSLGDPGGGCQRTRHAGGGHHGGDACDRPHAGRAPHAPPGRLLNFVNQHLTDRYTSGKGTFVTAFYGVFDPRHAADHHRQRGAQSGTHSPLQNRAALQHGWVDQHAAGDRAHRIATPIMCYSLMPGDALLLYTDGITEARNPAGRVFRAGSAGSDCCLDQPTGIRTAVAGCHNESCG